jgi:riboflavin kinase / FMN adenylyltransferase
LSGEVTHGDSRGKSLGFPTANLAIWESLNLPKPGVYSGWAEVNGMSIPAVTNVGFRPTFENKPAHPRVETHLLDYDGDLYTRRISISFVHFLREEKRFESVQALVEQVNKDIQEARELLEVRNDATIPGASAIHP